MLLNREQGKFELIISWPMEFASTDSKLEVIAKM
jgi:hypothetical protein